MSFVIEQRLGPPGKHVATLCDVESMQGKFGKPSFRWKFKIKDGSHAGLNLLKITGSEPRLGTSLGDLLAQLYQRDLLEGESVDPMTDFLGRDFEVIAVPGPDGNGVIIESIRPM